LEWECCYKDRFTGAAEGVRFINDMIISVSHSIFDAPMRRPLQKSIVSTILRNNDATNP